MTSIREVKVEVTTAPKARVQGRSGDTVQRILKRASDVVIKHPHASVAEAGDGDLVVSVHHTRSSQILRSADGSAADGLWGVHYDPVVPGTATKWFDASLTSLLDDLCRGEIPESADPY